MGLFGGILFKKSSWWLACLFTGLLWLFLADDNDNMPDSWESLYRLNVFIDDAADDVDGDGYSNLLEYKADTNPTDKKSYPLGFAKKDFNLDFISDIFWYRVDNGASQAWLMSASSEPSVIYNPFNGNLNFSPVAVGDLDGDGDSDILWRNAITGQNTVWLMEGGVFSIVYINVFLKEGYQFSGIGDFDGDGDKDILWRSEATGQNIIWAMKDGRRDLQVYPKAMTSNFSVKAVGDFNSDGIDDILWQQADGSTRVWLMKNNNIYSLVRLSAMNTKWAIQASGDFDADGDDDILIRNNLSGQNTIWVMEAGRHASQSYLPALDPSSAYSIVDIGDYDGDGDDDILWRNMSTGQNRIWDIQANARVSSHESQLGGILFRVVPSSYTNAFY